jgi:hypothetical protein
MEAGWNERIITAALFTAGARQKVVDQKDSLAHHLASSDPSRYPFLSQLPPRRHAM